MASFFISSEAKRHRGVVALCDRLGICDNTAVGIVVEIASFASTCPYNHIKPIHEEIVNKIVGVGESLSVLNECKILFYNDVEHAGRIYRFDKKLVTF